MWVCDKKVKQPLNFGDLVVIITLLMDDQSFGDQSEGTD